MRDPKALPDYSKGTMSPVEAEPQAQAGATAVPAYPAEPAPFLRSPLPPFAWLSPDNLRQYYRSGIPQTRIPPFSAPANAMLNTTATAIAKQIIATTPASSSGLTSVGLTAPNIFTVSGSPVTPPGPGPIVLGLATESPNTVWRGPTSGALGGLEGLASSGASTGVGGSATDTVTASPSTATSWGLYAGLVPNGSFTAPAGWTNVGSTTYLNSFSGTSPVSVSQTLGANAAETQALAIFSGTVPTVVQTNQATWGFSNPQSVSFSSSNTAGNAIIIILAAGVPASSGGGPFSLTASDSNGNAYSTLAFQTAAGSAWNSSLLILMATNIAGGANTVTFNVLGKQSGGEFADCRIIEITPPAAGPGLPFFGPLLQSDIPPIHLNSSGNGGVTNILRPINGGTGSDLSATGGASQVLKQATAGAAITVGTLALSDLSTNTGGNILTSQLNSGTNADKIHFFNGSGTNGQWLTLGGLGTVNSVGNTGNLGATTLLSAGPTSTSGVAYLVTVFETLDQVASVSSTLPDIQISWTDGFNSTARTFSFVSAAPSGNTLATFASGSLVIYAKNGTNVQYQIGANTAYASSGVTPMKYDYDIQVVPLGL